MKIRTAALMAASALIGATVSMASPASSAVVSRSAVTGSCAGVNTNLTGFPTAGLSAVRVYLDGVLVNRSSFRGSFSSLDLYPVGDYGAGHRYQVLVRPYDSRGVALAQTWSVVGASPAC